MQDPTVMQEALAAVRHAAENAARLALAPHDLEQSPPPNINLYRHIIDAAEQGMISTTLQNTGYNQVAAAQIMGINRATLRERRQRHRL